MTRTQALTVIVFPLAIAMAADDAGVRAQEVMQQPMVSRSGIDLPAMDAAADPCSDFYQYACGGWIKSHPAPADQPYYGRFHELQDRNNAILRDILDEAAKPSAPAEQRKIGDYYASCMAETEISSKGRAPLAPDLQRIDAIKDKVEIPAVAGHMQTIGAPVFFSFGTDADLKDATRYMIVFAQGGLSLPDRDYYLNDDANAQSVRAGFEKHVSKMLQLAGETAARADASAKSIVKVETALATSALDRVSRRNPDNVYHKMSRDEVKKLMPSFNMSQYLERAEAAPGNDANVSEPKFLEAVDRVIAATPLPELKEYMRWRAVHANAAMLPKAFVDENFAFYGKALTGAQEQTPRWKRCVEATDGDLGESLGKAYVERTFGPEGKARTLEMVKAIEAAMGGDIDAIDWMTADTKKAARVKLQAVANKIGYPERWRDYSALRIVRGDAYGNSQRANAFEYRRQMAKVGKPVDKTEWLMTPPTVNAYYNPQENNINFPAGILQPPFFNKGADDAVNFGAAAAVVGHELTHGFDDQGRRFDAEGNLRDWWTAADGKAFEDRALCVDKQYSGYSATADGSVKINGKLTLGENVADNGGLRLAWMALAEVMKTKQLPASSDNLTPQQRFFVGWAQMWCENRTDEVARLHAKINPHSPGRYRTNGVVSNMPEFANAFSCKAAAPMVSQPVCKVW
jgi:putative endopeptidase